MSGDRPFKGWEDFVEANKEIQSLRQQLDDIKQKAFDYAVEKNNLKTQLTTVRAERDIYKAKAKALEKALKETNNRGEA